MNILRKFSHEITIDFEKNFSIYWNHLPRFTNLLIILNISLFFVTERITRQGYYFTYFSLFFLGIIQFFLLIPRGCTHRIRYYLFFVLCEIMACYFLISSIWFWVVTSQI